MSEPFNFNKLDRPGRPTNAELCAAFRELLTKRFYVVDENGDEYTGNELREEALRATKPWRNELWQKFREIEDRLCPVEAMAREKRKSPQ